MAQQKTSTHTNADQPRDEDGRFTDKDDAQRSGGERLEIKGRRQEVCKLRWPLEQLV